MGLFKQPRSQGLSSLPPLSLRTTMEAEKRDPGNEVAIQAWMLSSAFHNTAAKRTAHEYEFELPVETHFRLCIKIQWKQDKIPYREV